MSTKLLPTKLRSAPLTKRRACVVPMKHGANRDQSKTEGNRYHVTNLLQSYSLCTTKQWKDPRVLAGAPGHPH